jgi:hypothetical protein
MHPGLVLFLAAAAVVPRVIYALSPHVCFGDEACYLWLAENLFSGRGYTYYAGRPETHLPPLFPIALGILNWIVRDWEVVSSVAYVVFGSLLLIPVTLLARAMYGQRPALIAALLVAFAPAFTSGFLFTGTASEPLYVFLVFTGIHCVFRAAMSQRPGFHAAAGVAFSLACLTRPEGFGFFAGSLVYLLLTLVVWRPVPPRRAAAGLALYVAAFLVTASPYMAYLHHHTGSFSLSDKETTSYTTTRGLVDRDFTAFQSDTWGLDAHGEVKYYAGGGRSLWFDLLPGEYHDRVLRDVKKNAFTAADLLSASWVYGRVLMVLGILGLLAVPWKEGRVRAEALNLICVMPVFVFFLFFVRERHLYGSLLPFYLWAALGVGHSLEWIAATEFPGVLARRRARRVMKVLFLSGLMAYLLFKGHAFFARKDASATEVWSAARWLQENTPPEAVVLSTGPEVAFHARRRWLPVPVANREELVAYARRHGGTHVILRGKYLNVRPEQEADLFTNARSDEDLELRARFGTMDDEQRDDSQDPVFVVYRVLGVPLPAEG